MKNWKANSEWLCRQVAGDDLVNVPTYFVSTDELEAYDPRLRNPNCLAWTGVFADLILCDFLHRAGQWCGRGFGCIVDVSQMKHEAELLAIVGHELAHYLTQPQPIDLAGDLELGIDLVRVAAKVWSNPKPEADAVKRPPWDKHEADFVRAASHIAIRAGELVGAIRPSMVRFATPYHNFPNKENEFVTALGDELGSRLPIREILKTDPPKRFKDRWAAATAWWTAETVNEDRV